MLRYPCLVLDHDDTVVQSEADVNYPCFLLALEKFRPGESMSLEDFTRWCFHPGFARLLQDKYHFTEEEMALEFQMWISYAREHIPPAYPGMREIILEQKRRGGLVCVVSHSSRETILRDYAAHIGTAPDEIYAWELPAGKRKPAPYPLLDIMEKYGLSSQQLLVVDDLKAGSDMARSAGVPFAFAAWSKLEVPEIRAYMERISDYAFSSPAQLKSFLFGE